jgi:hypothetical protein
MRPAATTAGASGSKEGEAGGLLAAALGFAPSVAWGATRGAGVIEKILEPTWYN